MDREGPLFILWRNNRRGKVPGHKLRKGYSNQADAEFAEDNILPGPEEYWPEEDEDAEDENKVPGVFDDDEEDREFVEVEDDDEEQSDEDGWPVDEDGNRILPDDLAAEFERTRKHLFWHTGIDIAQLRGQADGDPMRGE
jgi:hypothetical protein